MSFQRPELLLLGPAVALLLSLALRVQWRRLVRLGGAYGHVAAKRLVPRGLQRFPARRMLYLGVACFALGAAAAGPRIDEAPPPEPPPPLDLAVAVDVSRSMGADDVAPSRIGRAREVVDRLAEALPSARIVLILFADWPYTLVPPTDDFGVVRYFAQSLSVDLVLDRDQGTSFTTTLAHARAELDSRPRPNARRAVLLISDGGAHEDRASVLAAASSASGDGVGVWTAGLGTSGGGAVGTGTGLLTDQAEASVVTSLEEDLLRDIAQAGDGTYNDVSTDRGLRALLDGLGALGDDAPVGPSPPPDPAFWLTLLAVPLLLVEGAADAGRTLRRRRERDAA